VEMEEEAPQPVRAGRLPWPPSLPERVRAVRDCLMQVPAPIRPEAVAPTFTRARVPEVTAILETLAAIGQAPARRERISRLTTGGREAAAGRGPNVT
jgi:hypothetical protein